MPHGQATIQTLLGELVKNRHLLPSMRRVMALSLWDHVVGNPIARKTWPERVTDGVLTVGVANHAWADELHLLKPQILSRYRQLLGRSAVKDIEFRVGRRRGRRKDEATARRARLMPAPGEALALAPVPARLLDGVTNPQVRELLAPAFARLRAERDWKHEHGWSRCAACQRIYHGAACPHCGTRQDAT